MRKKDVFLFLVNKDYKYQNLLESLLRIFGYSKFGKYNFVQSYIENLYKKPDVIIIENDLLLTNATDLIEETAVIDPRVQFIVLYPQGSGNKFRSDFKNSVVNYICKDENTGSNIEKTLRSSLKNMPGRNKIRFLAKIKSDITKAQKNILYYLNG